MLSDSAGARTQDPILKRDVLYLLSYGISIFLKSDAKVKIISNLQRKVLFFV